MRKLFKIGAVFLLICFILGFGIQVMVGYSLIVPAFKDSGITFTEFLKKEWEPEKTEKLEENLMERADVLSERYLKSIKNTVNKIFFPGQDMSESNSKVKQESYSIDEIMEIQEKNAQEGLEEGLNILKEQEKENQKSIQEGFKHLEGLGN